MKFVFLFLFISSFNAGASPLEVCFRNVVLKSQDRFEQARVRLIKKIVNNIPDPIARPQSIKIADVQKKFIEDDILLRERGVVFNEVRGENALYEYAKHKPTLQGELRQILRLGLYEITHINPSKTKSVFQHPELPTYMARLKAHGHKLVVDPSADFLSYGAYYYSAQKVIALRVGSSWSDFIHEFQHFLFQIHVMDRFDSLKMEVLANGTKLKDILPPETYQALGGRRIESLQRLIEAELPNLAIDETMSFYDELNLMGYQKFNVFSSNPEFILKSYEYILRHQINELRKPKDGQASWRWEDLSPREQKSMTLALRNRYLSMGTRQGINASKSLGIATAVGAGITASLDVFFNEQMGIIIVIEDGKVKLGIIPKWILAKLKL